MQYQSTVNHTLLMQLTRGSQEDMVLPEDTVLLLTNRPMLEEFEHRLTNSVELQEKLVIWQEHNFLT